MDFRASDQWPECRSGVTWLERVSVTSCKRTQPTVCRIPLSLASANHAAAVRDKFQGRMHPVVADWQASPGSAARPATHPWVHHEMGLYFTYIGLIATKPASHPAHGAGHDSPQEIPTVEDGKNPARADRCQFQCIRFVHPCIAGDETVCRFDHALDKRRHASHRVDTAAFL